MEIKKKIELKVKGETANIPELSQAVVQLEWINAGEKDVDLDLMAFIEKKDGTTFSVFTDLISGGNMGDLNEFPCMKLDKDAGVGETQGKQMEKIQMPSIHKDIAKIHFVALNYTEAVAKNADASFSDYDGTITIIDQSGEAFEVRLDSKEKGVAALIATIDNTSPIGATLINENRVMDLSTLASEVPGSDVLAK
jgi:tellurite resistance protein TerA